MGCGGPSGKGRGGACAPSPCSWGQLGHQHRGPCGKPPPLLSPSPGAGRGLLARGQPEPQRRDPVGPGGRRQVRGGAGRPGDRVEHPPAVPWPGGGGGVVSRDGLTPDARPLSPCPPAWRSGRRCRVWPTPAWSRCTSCTRGRRCPWWCGSAWPPGSRTRTGNRAGGGWGAYVRLGLGLGGSVPDGACRAGAEPAVPQAPGGRAALFPRPDALPFHAGAAGRAPGQPGAGRRGLHAEA